MDRGNLQGPKVNRIGDMPQEMNAIEIEARAIFPKRCPSSFVLAGGWSPYETLSPPMMTIWACGRSRRILAKARMTMWYPRKGSRLRDT